MKRYEWYSELAPEQVRARLLMRAKPMKSVLDTYDERQTLVKFLPEGRFYLWKTGGLWRPQLPFVGTVTPWEKGSLITGDFEPTNAMKAQVTVMAAVVFFVALLFIQLWTVSLIVALLAGGMWWGLLRGVAPHLSERQNRETMRFIEEELLRE